MKFLVQTVTKMLQLHAFNPFPMLHFICASMNFGVGEVILVRENDNWKRVVTFIIQYIITYMSSILIFQQIMLLEGNIVIYYNDNYKIYSLHH